MVSLPPPRGILTVSRPGFPALAASTCGPPGPWQASQPTPGSTHFDPASRKLLLWSIVLHNFPVSIALLGMLLQSGLPRNRALGFLALFGTMAPLGMSMSAHTVLAAYSRELMAVVIGIFMHISTTILFETSDVHRFNYAKLGAIGLGTGLGILSVMLH